MVKNYTLHDLPAEERPRERLEKIGVDNLSIQELLALIIERGRRGQNVLSIAQNLLAEFGSLTKIKEASLKELQQVKGVGFATACKLKAAFKLGEKALAKHKRCGQKIESPEDVYHLLKQDLAAKKKEHFVVLSLSSRSRLISVDRISVGTLNANLAHPREIFQAGIQNSAASLILVHNHPSGELEPSADDLMITQKLKKAGQILDIEVADHIIIAADGFFSFAENKLLTK